MKTILRRSLLNPILKPIKSHSWESQKLYNPGAVYWQGKYHLYYRAMGTGPQWQSVIGHAISEDGEHFERFSQPILIGKGKEEFRGLEDPRISVLSDKLVMAYGAFDGNDVRICTATSLDGFKWKRQGRAFSNWSFSESGGKVIHFNEKGMPVSELFHGERSKSGGIFPEKIDGKYMMLFGEFCMWFATSDDGIHWTAEKTPFLNPRKGDFFDNTFVEMGPSPIKTKKGWLVLYHGVNTSHMYQIGALLLDLSNPRVILHRTTQSLFKPKETYELQGLVDVLPGGIAMFQKMSNVERDAFVIHHVNVGTMPQVVFCCGAVVTNSLLRIYYGASDSVICTASARMRDVLTEVLSS